MTLSLEIEFLTGCCRAARSPSSETPDWPPQPDRIFSALVASWAARGGNADEQAALEWLEGQPPPVLCASPHEIRTAPDVFVPPNDFRSSASATTYAKVLPDRRPRQPRRFPVARPHDPVMYAVWNADSTPHLPLLNAIARDITYLGHSTSLVRCRFLLGEPDSCHAPAKARNRVYPGRLAELAQAHEERPARPVIPAAASFVEPAREPHAGPSSPLILEAIGDVPDILASAPVCRQLRLALMSGYRREFGPDGVPETISGHDRDGRPTKEPHIAIQPMAFVGYRHGDGRVFGYAVIPPRSSAILDSSDFRRAFARIAQYDEGHERRILTLDGPPLRAPVKLSPAGDTPKRSLSFGPYVHPSSVWASVTPVVLDRHLKRRDEDEAQELIAVACERAGLPRPSTSRIRVGKHSAIVGAPPSRPPSGAPHWSGWRVPKHLATRPLVHVAIDFECDVEGPVLIGAGRFAGLGLFRGTRT